MILNTEIIRQFPGLIAVKDLHSKHIHTSDVSAKLCGWKNSTQMEGSADSELPCRASEHADTFIAQDQYVINSGCEWIGFDIVHYINGWHVIFSKKKPLRDEHGQISGVLLAGIDFSDHHLLGFFKSLFNMDLALYSSQANMVSYRVHNKNNSIFDNLSNRERECLFYLVRGKSTKSVSDLLNISTRTTETHIDNIKIKLNCRNKQELIEIALINGYLHTIPKSVLQRHLSIELDF